VRSNLENCQACNKLVGSDDSVMPDMEADDRGKNDDYYLELSPDPIRFESVSCLTNVFFDDSKQQVSQLNTCEIFYF